MDAPGVDVECVLISGGAAGLRYRFVRGTLTGAERPDDAALRLSAAAEDAVCHSTSWRYESGTVVLTSTRGRTDGPAPHPTNGTLVAQVATRVPFV